MLKSIIQSEDVIVNIVRSRAVAYELKELAKMEWVSTVNLDGSGNKDYQRIWIRRRLNVHTFDSVLDSPDAAELTNDGLGTLKLVSLKRQHGAFVLCETHRLEQQQWTRSSIHRQRCMTPPGTFIATRRQGILALTNSPAKPSTLLVNVE